MSYNGWQNYETWKFNLEVLDGWDLEELLEAIGFSQGEEMPPVSVIEDYLSAWFDDYIEAMEGEPFLKEWASIAFENVRFREIAEHVHLDAESSDFFLKEEEEDAEEETEEEED
jgi:hypothetical protein